MKKKTKSVVVFAVILLIIGSVCMAVGFIGGGSVLHFADFAKAKYFQVISSEEKVIEFTHNDYESSIVHEIEIDIDAAKVIIQIGDRLSVRSENTTSARVTSKIDSKGTLKIEDERYGFLFDSRKILPPTVYITIPNDMSLDSFSVECEVGSVYGENISIITKESDFSVDVGSIEMSGITSAGTEIETSVGDVKLVGTFTGETDISCDLGSVALHTIGSLNDWTYVIDSKLGSVNINGEKMSGSAIKNSAARLPNHFDVECNLGNVEIMVANTIHY